MGSSVVWVYDPAAIEYDLSAPLEGKWYYQGTLGPPVTPVLRQARYYPSVVLTALDPFPLLPTDPRKQGEMIIAGGSPAWSITSSEWNSWDDCEVFYPGPRSANPAVPQGTWIKDPSSPSLNYLCPGPNDGNGNGRFGWYPRLFLTPEGRFGHAAKGWNWGASGSSASWTSLASYPYPNGTAAVSWSARGLRNVSGAYGPVVLYPNLDANYTNTLMAFAGAGAGGTSPSATTNVEWSNTAAGSTTVYWPNGTLWTSSTNPPPPPPLLFPTPIPPPEMSIARGECNAVILPNATILVLGDGSMGASKIPELFAGGAWATCPPETSRRDHHATALLLPSGRVISMGGNFRSKDFQICEPHYFAYPRPAWGQTPVVPNETLQRGTTYYNVPVSLPAGTSVSKVVLTRCGSLTHHADLDQHYVELKILWDQTTSQQVTFRAPDGPPQPGQGSNYVAARPGWYMIWLLNNAGRPSTAQFVRFV